ncbi:MAG: hypothetical protein [Caudoviricetes sp.]|nr:MAG: hypothetical protein [Caudoviricetes sp.]
MMSKKWAMVSISCIYGSKYFFYGEDNFDLLIFNLWFIGAYIVDAIVTNKPSK